MQIKRLKNKDENILEYSKLAKKIISKIPYYSLTAKKEEMKKFSLKNLRKNIKDKNKVYIYAIKNKKIVGFCCGYFDCGTFWGEWAGVDADFRGKGIAIIMQNYLENLLEKCKIHKMWVDSRTNNKESINFLIKKGFRKITIIKKHWYKQDFYLWEKFLK